MKKKVFIVHGHDDKLKNEVYIFLANEGFQPVILHHEANEGQTIIEKLEKHIDTVSMQWCFILPVMKGKPRMKLN
nr:TIR domain-containing protein [Escherichia coli]